ncbi:MAG: toxin YoeB [Parasphingorhabdus sp.]|jgi:toxin YoeB
MESHLYKTNSKRCLKLSSSGLKSKAVELIQVLKRNPYQNPLPFEKLIGDLAGCCSRRINIQHRLVYKILEKEQIVKV